MGRKRIDPELRKERITIVLPKYLIDELRQTDGYNHLIEVLLKDYFRKKKSENS